MKLIFLISTLLVAIAAETILPRSECRQNDLQKLGETMKHIGLRLLHLKFLRDPSKTQSVAPMPVICILAQIAHHDDGPLHRKIMKLLNMRSLRELRQVLKAARQAIGNLKSQGKDLYKVFGDNNHTFSKVFKRNFATICGGLTENIDFSDSCKAVNHVNQWFQAQSYSYPYSAADESLFKKPGLVFTNYFIQAVDLNHPNNPSGIKKLDFYTVDNKVLTYLGLYGNGYLEFGYFPELDSEIVKVPLKDNGFGYFIRPNDPEMLPFVEDKLSNVTYFNKVMASLEPMCINFTLIVGAVYSVNKLDQDLNQLGIDLNGYHNCSSDVKVNGVIQKIDLTARPQEKRASVDSHLCRDGPYREVVMRTNLIYHFTYNFGGTSTCGVFTGPLFGGDID